MKIPTRNSNRKAISPVLATVILIAITLIAAIAIAGFVFGLFGSFTSSAQVSASSVVCHTTAHANCVAQLLNTGTSNVSTTGCSLNIGGSAAASTITAGGGSIGAGGAAVSTTCQVTANVAGGAVGSQAVGSISLSNGGTVAFTATWVT